MSSSHYRSKSPLRFLYKLRRANQQLLEKTPQSFVVLDILYARVRLRVYKKIKNSAFVSCMTDEAQDSLKNKNHGVFIKFLGESGVEEGFWNIKPLHAEGTGVNIARHVVQMLRPLNPWSVLMSVATDGCGAMAGAENGMKSHLIRWLVPFGVKLTCSTWFCKKRLRRCPSYSKGFR